MLSVKLLTGLALLTLTLGACPELRPAPVGTRVGAAAPASSGLVTIDHDGWTTYWVTAAGCPAPSVVKGANGWSCAPGSVERTAGGCTCVAP